MTTDAVPQLDPYQDVAVITPHTDGPLIVRGSFRLQDEEGNEIQSGRRTVALCRCGRSGSKPFCDSTHKTSGFRATSARQQGEAAQERRIG